MQGDRLVELTVRFTDMRIAHCRGDRPALARAGPHVFCALYPLCLPFLTMVKSMATLLLCCTACLRLQSLFAAH